PVLSLRGSGISTWLERLARHRPAWHKPGTTREENRMKLGYFDDFKLGVLKNDAVVDVSAAVKDIPHSGPGDLMNGLIEHWDSYKPQLEEAVARGAGGALSGGRIRSAG